MDKPYMKARKDCPPMPALLQHHQLQQAFSLTLSSPSSKKSNAATTVSGEKPTSQYQTIEQSMTSSTMAPASAIVSEKDLIILKQQERIKQLEMNLSKLKLENSYLLNEYSKVVSNGNACEQDDNNEEDNELHLTLSPSAGLKQRLTKRASYENLTPPYSCSSSSSSSTADTNHLIEEAIRVSAMPAITGEASESCTKCSDRLINR
jgi:hypothetical protein